MEERIIKDINNLLTQLFSKMKEADYEWDAEKKELKKIAQKTIEGTFINVDEVRENFVREIYRILANDATNDRANDIIYYFDSLPTIYLHTNKLLPSDGDDFDINHILKNHAWSEEDEKMLNFYEKDYNNLLGNWKTKDVIEHRMQFRKWLKSLKERYTWKPSDEQMEALLKLEEMHVLEHEKNQENAHLYMVIKSLKEQLFKLKGK